MSLKVTSFSSLRFRLSFGVDLQGEVDCLYFAISLEEYFDISWFVLILLLVLVLGLNCSSGLDKVRESGF